MPRLPRRRRATAAVICVVEEPLDILAIESTRGFHGLYHVLHGVISPMDGIGPEDLKVVELLDRLRGGTVTEVIMATNPNLEGEATSMYVSRLLSPWASASRAWRAACRWAATSSTPTTSRCRARSRTGRTSS